jgi:hypothetical protein
LPRTESNTRNNSFFEYSLSACGSKAVIFQVYRHKSGQSGILRGNCCLLVKVAEWPRTLVFTFTFINGQTITQRRRSQFGSKLTFNQTTIMAVQFKDGVVVGADSRTTTGSYIGKETSKFSKQSHR